MFNHAESFANKLVMGMIGPMSTLSERVRHAKAARGMTDMTIDKGVAAVLGRKPRGLNALTADVIAGKRKPTADVLEAMASFLRIDPGWLLAGRGGMDPESSATATYDSVPGWEEAARAELKRDRVRAYVIRAAGRSPVLVTPREVTPELVFQVATLWLSTATDAAREEAAKAG